MSFDSICNGCGAPSGPSVGICPFCKAVLSSKSGKEDPSLKNLIELHHRGQIDRALSLGSEMEKQKPDLKNELAFVLAFAKILIEAEGPTSKIRGLLTAAQMTRPENTELHDYLEIMDAKNLLRKGSNDPGELLLKNLLKRTPGNAHAHFIFGAHLFWIDEQPAVAISHLEAAVRLHPGFLRAWGCLGAVYKKLGNEQLAKMAFQKCSALETNAAMKQYFESQSK